jgi:hypothetical protein
MQVCFILSFLVHEILTPRCRKAACLLVMIAALLIRQSRGEQRISGPAGLLVFSFSIVVRSSLSGQGIFYPIGQIFYLSVLLYSLWSVK